MNRDTNTSKDGWSSPVTMIVYLLVWIHGLLLFWGALKGHEWFERALLTYAYSFAHGLIAAVLAIRLEGFKDGKVWTLRPYSWVVECANAASQMTVFQIALRLQLRFWFWGPTKILKQIFSLWGYKEDWGTDLKDKKDWSWYEFIKRTIRDMIDTISGYRIRVGYKLKEATYC